jgi:hypothetical protein
MTEEILFHPSSLGSLMGGVNAKEGTLTQTAKKKCIEVYARHKYRRYESFENKYTKKGISVEDDSIKLYNKLQNTRHIKNTVKYKNELLIGTPDIVDDKIKDAKSSYSILTYLSSITGELNSDYYWQLQAYMMLTGRTESELFYALVNSTAEDLTDAKNRLKWKYKVIDNEPLDYIKECRMIERNGIFDLSLFQYDNPYFEFHSDTDSWNYDILPSERLHIINIPASEEAFKKIENKIIQCRSWIKTNLV